MSEPFQFFLSVLAVWRISHLLSAEDGPWDLVFHLQKQLGQGFFGNLLDCFYCLSIWIAVPFAIWMMDGWVTFIVYWLAISGGACIIEKVLRGEK
jgi:Protein of unknown function (DUF1360)